VVQPVLINYVIKYFKGEISLALGSVYALVLVICLTVYTALHHPYFYQNMRYGMQIRIAVSGLIYKKVGIFSIINFYSRDI
jgi:hypothetical protein